MIQKLTITSQTILGLIFIVFGMNGFFNFIPIPPLAPAGLSFMRSMQETGYLFQLVKGIEVAAGLLLLTTRFVPLALVLLGPIVVNILLFHIFLDKAGIPVGVGVTVLYSFVLWSHRKLIKLLF